MHTHPKILSLFIYIHLSLSHTLIRTVSVIEVLPRDKKAREEKINILGQSNIDLLPIVRGQTVISDAVSLFHPSLEQTDSEPVGHFY